MSLQSRDFHSPLSADKPVSGSQPVERIEFEGELLAMIVRAHFSSSGVHFFTPNDFSQQLAFMKHPKGKAIQPHLHNSVVRSVEYTQEVLFIRKGCLRVDFYTTSKEYISSRKLFGGDVILLAKGGHGFEVLEDLEMIEVKQGPYAGEADKTRFDSIDKPDVFFQE